MKGNQSPPPHFYDDCIYLKKLLFIPLMIQEPPFDSRVLFNTQINIQMSIITNNNKRYTTSDGTHIGITCTVIRVIACALSHFNE